MLYFVVLLTKGAHSPGPRCLSVGIYPIQNVDSRILDQQDVSLLKGFLQITNSFAPTHLFISVFNYYEIFFIFILEPLFSVPSKMVPISPSRMRWREFASQNQKNG